MKNKILFLSGLDFKEKSIQVIGKTPEAYAKAGWDVRYIVARDTTDRGNYFYEAEINPDGLHIERFHWPLARCRNAARGRLALYLFTKLAGFLLVFQLAWRGARALREDPVDVIYGYEMHGVLAVRLLRLFWPIGRAKTVHRFQGTWGFYGILEQRDWIRMLANTDLILALRARADRVIMTNDGSRGDRVLQRVAAHNLPVVRFWPNGVDIPDVPSAPQNTTSPPFNKAQQPFRFISVSRLIRGKGLERCIAVLAKLNRTGASFTYRIIGEGPQRAELERLVAENGLTDIVTFAGAIPHSMVFENLSHSDCVLSMYDHTNVGNPLLEAIRSEKIIVTLNNGGTGEWIRHNINGLIYDLAPGFTEVISSDLARLINDSAWQDLLLKGVRELSRDKLWTWQDRMRTEVEDVERLTNG